MGAERSYIECKYEPDSKFAVAAVAAVAVAAADIVVVAKLRHRPIFASNPDIGQFSHQDQT